MSRNRVIPHTQALYVGPSPANSVHTNLIEELTRVQSVSHSWTVEWSDIRQYNRRAPIDRVILETPIVNIDITYLLTDGRNEKFLGFNINGTTSALAHILDKTQDEKNYFQLTVPEGSDAAGNTNRANHRVYAFGNAYISSYSVNATIGELPTATVSLEALNVNYDSGSSGNYVPAINPETGEDNSTHEYELPESVGMESGQVTALRPGDITIDLADLDGVVPGAVWDGAGKAHIQSFDLEVAMTRTPQQRLGSKFAFSREIDPLIPVTLNITADMSEVGAGKLSNIVRQCSSTGADIEIAIRECSDTGVGAVAMRYIVKNARVTEGGIDGDLDSNESVTVSLSGYVGAVEDTDTNFFIYGSYNDSPEPSE